VNSSVANPALANPHLANPRLGIALVIATAVCFTALDTTVKQASTLVPVLLVLWVRYAFQALAMAVWLLITRRQPGGAGFASAHPGFQFTRGALLLTTSALSFFSLQYLPVAEFTALILLTPLIVTLLAGAMLKQAVSPLRWAVVVGGFIGALVIVRPGSGVFGWAALMPVAAALCYAFFQVLTAKWAGRESPYTTHFYSGLVGAVVLLPALLVLAPTDTASGAAFVASLTPTAIGLLLLAGLLGTVGHLSLIFALGVAPAATLMPFMYLQIPMAAALGFAIFGHQPDGWAWVGMAIVGACGALGAWLNLRGAPRTAAVVTQDTQGD
jgi:drug/metabolite transporter (DMT)-like permease